MSDVNTNNTNDNVNNNGQQNMPQNVANNANNGQQTAQQENVQQAQQDASAGQNTGEKSLSNLLKKLGFDSEDSLTNAVTEYNKIVESNKSDAQKKDDKIATLIKELADEKRNRTIADAKLSAIKLGVKTDLVDDVVLVAMARVTPEKDIDKVIAEMKDNAASKIYFEDNTEDKNDKNTTKKRTVTNNNSSTQGNNSSNDDKNKNSNGGNNNNSNGGGSLAERLLKSTRKTQNYYYGKGKN